MVRGDGDLGLVVLGGEGQGLGGLGGEDQGLVVQGGEDLGFGGLGGEGLGGLGGLGGERERQGIRVLKFRILKLLVLFLG